MVNLCCKCRKNSKKLNSIDLNKKQSRISTFVFNGFVICSVSNGRIVQEKFGLVRSNIKYVFGPFGPNTLLCSADNGQTLTLYSACCGRTYMLLFGRNGPNRPIFLLFKMF